MQALLLSQKQPKAPAQRNAMARPLVIRREARRVRRLGDLPVEHLLERVLAAGGGAGAVGGDVHEMHVD